MTISRPTPLHYPFASSATPGHINTLPDTATGNYLASWQEGFPPITMTPVAGGGVSPAGADFNGLLNAISAGVRWTGAGGLPGYDAAVSSAIGGYPKGAVLALSSTTLGLVAATTDGATADPNSSMTGWAPFGGIYGGGAASWALDSSTTANSVALTTRLPLEASAVATGMSLRFIRAGLTNTSTSVSVSVNGVAYPNLAQLDGQSVPAGSLVYGAAYDLIYDGSKWRITQPLAASATDAQAQTAANEFLSPAGLASALKGANQSLTSNGYQKLPGGLIVQWASAYIGDPQASPYLGATILPMAFPNANLFSAVSVKDTSVYGNIAASIRSTSNTMVNWTVAEWHGDVQDVTVNIFALGY